MPLAGLPVTWSDTHLQHTPGSEIWVGVPVAGDEMPERVERIREALVGAGASVVEAEAHGDTDLVAVHDVALLEFLRTAWDTWNTAGYEAEVGQARVVPYIFPHPGLVDVAGPLAPTSRAAHTGLFAYDTMTPIGPGTWQAARGAVDATLTACSLVLRGEAVAYACTRPPGHHVTRTAYGGSCYLNNGAIAAEHLRAHGCERVAIVDIDAHHGNGAQSIFWERPDVLTVSVHVDPAAGWFPHFLGLADERGGAAGGGTNLNLPVPPGAGDAEWVSTVAAAAARAVEFAPDVLVVPLGVDAARGDPNSPLAVTANGYRAAGRLLAGLRVPTVVVQEGGYDLATIGGLVLAFFEGFTEGKKPDA
jgi:acetoin utilization deacetylase AcuC-like enzyme